MTTLDIVTTLDQLDQLVKVVQDAGAFAFDIESRAILERHPDLQKIMEDEFKKKALSLKSKSSDVLENSRRVIEEAYKKDIAVNPLRNEVFWISIATFGHSWAIPMGHKLGTLLEPEEVGDGSTVPPEGYRKRLKSGEESMAKARYNKPAVHAEPPKQLSRSEVFEALKPIFFSDLVKVGHNVKFDARSISKYYDQIPPGPYMDTMVLQHIVSENLMSYSLEKVIAHNYDGLEAYAKGGKLGKLITQVSIEDATLYVHRDARWTWMLYQRLHKQIITKPDLLSALQLDSKVIEVLMHMENNGIPVDVKDLKNLNLELDQELRDILFKIFEHAPAGFNPDSNKSKQEFLFTPKKEGGLGLKPYKKTEKGAPSVDEESLRNLQSKHPIVPLLLEWAEMKKLKSTYVDGLLPKMYKSRLHPSFHLHRTATGRLSSSDPNLQNIPRESNIRKLFVAPQHHQLFVADYDQIELRIMAMFSQDPQLVRIFNTGEDIHTATAAAVFKKDPKDVTSEERQIGKGVNFLTAYGGGSAKLARTTGIEEDHAMEILNNYYKSFAGLTAWKQSVVATGRKQGYVSTLEGRRRRLPDLTSNDNMLRSRAERQAVNAVIQGSAADICKKAMINVHNALHHKGVRLLVQVHDELIAAVPDKIVEESTQPFLDAMGDGTVIQQIPLRVSYEYANNWAEAKG
jgi:DNA polymerase I